MTSEKIDQIKKLVEIFGANIKEYKGKNYDEANTRVDFIDKIFEVLDWDVRNTNNYSEAYRDVVREDKILIDNKPKAPDYSFRIGGVRKFFLEAKKPSVNIKDDIEPAYQLRRYSYTAKLPLSILTDFEEFAVYDTRIKPEKNDKASTARIFYCTYDEYIRNIEFIYNTFSKTAVLTGSFDKYIIENKNKKGSSEVDKEFLLLIESWRETLAKNIALRNKDISLISLNKVVQLIIDRIIFLRIAEDRNMETYGALQVCASGSNVYSNLNSLFSKANDKYNSGLFHEEEWIKSVTIDDKILQNIIKFLYYPDSPYEMSILPVEILGHIYEQFLGKTIRLTNSHQAKIEEKENVRKAGGVYYTPDYIVNHIIDNTLGKIIDQEDLYKHPRIKVLDPSCGSGSFLVAAYSYLLQKYLSAYTNKKNLDKCLKNGLIYQSAPSTYNLTISVKQNILLNHIFGVDIDDQAVEVTKLSLLLKLLENENQESANVLFKHSDLKLLPDLKDNIKSGNSLVEKDFFVNSQNEDLFSEETVDEIRPFEWKKEFAEIINNGGFDCIIGNPPYGADLREDVREYLLKKNTYGNTDTAALFIINQLKLLSKNGIGGYIVPKALLFASNWEKIRALILPYITRITDVSKAWKEVKLEQVIYFINKNQEQEAYLSESRNPTNNLFLDLGTIDKKHARDFNFLLAGISKNELALGLKIKNGKRNLNDYFENHRGGMFQKHIEQSNGEYKVLGGKNINRFYINPEIKGFVNKNYVDKENSFIKEDSILVQRIVAHIANPFDRIQITAASSDSLKDGKFVIVDTVNQLTKKEDIETRLIIGILNSKLMNWYLYRFVFAKAIRTMQFDNPVTSRIPIPEIVLDNRNPIVKEMVLIATNIENNIAKSKTLEKNFEKSDSNKTLDILIDKLDYLVYKLYDLDNDQISLVQQE